MEELLRQLGRIEERLMVHLLQLSGESVLVVRDPQRCRKIMYGRDSCQSHGKIL